MIRGENLTAIQNLWLEGKLTNFEYLTQLNKVAGRSFNDLMQYPVFPFVLSCYNEDYLNLDDKSIYRLVFKCYKSCSLQLIDFSFVDSTLSCLHKHLRPVYTKRQRRLCYNAAMTLAILFSLKTMESLENGLQSKSGATPLFSMRTESQASSQSCHSVDADAWYKRTLTHL